MPLPMLSAKPHAKAELPANKAKLFRRVEWKTKFR